MNFRSMLCLFLSLSYQYVSASIDLFPESFDDQESQENDIQEKKLIPFDEQKWDEKVASLKKMVQESNNKKKIKNFSDIDGADCKVRRQYSFTLYTGQGFDQRNAIHTIYYDLTDNQSRCMPCLLTSSYERKIYKQGLKTLRLKNQEVFPSKDLGVKTVYGIGSDQDAVRRWTIVARSIIKNDNNDWYSHCFSSQSIRESEIEAKILLRALQERNIQLDDDTMSQLRRIDRLE